MHARRNFGRTAVLAMIGLLAQTESIASEPASLGESYRSEFRIGVAVANDTLRRPDVGALRLTSRHFNTVTPENLMKWKSLHPRPGVYDFTLADQFVDFAEQYGMHVVGHTLVWHRDLPRWVYTDDQGRDVSREDLLATLKDHVQTVVGRYRGRVNAWDVVNEAINDDGTPRQTPWRRIIGDDYVEHAFAFAQEADPSAELYYNDFNLIFPEKRRAAIRLVQRLRAAGRRIDAVGIQGHWAIDWPADDDVDLAIKELTEAVGKVAISELDVNVLAWPGEHVDPEAARRAIGSAEFDPYTDGLPDAEQQRLARRYVELFKVFRRYSDRIDRVTLWSLDDGRTYQNDWPIRGRTAHPMLFDRALRPKPALFALLNAAKPRRPTDSPPSPRDDQQSGPVYRDPSSPIKKRVDDLLSRMTLEEKVAQMVCIWNEKRDKLLDERGRFDPALADNHFGHGHGLGQVGRPGDTGDGAAPADFAALTNAIQAYFLENTRLGIPVLFHNEALHGFVARDATSFPQPIGLAATFDPDLVERLYAMAAREARACGVHQALCPVVDVARDPRWGRVEETFGEDPYLVGVMGRAAVEGLQGTRQVDEPDRVIATLKHFAAHGQPESGSNCGPVSISERHLRETFLRPFEVAIRGGGAMSVMASYNEIDGVPSHANRWLLSDVLRGEWGFDGTVVSDYYAIRELHERPDFYGHHVAIDGAEAASLAVRAGVDIELPEPDCYPSLATLVREGVVPETVLDQRLRPLLSHKFALGLFEKPFVDAGGAEKIVGNKEHRELALEAARKTITLLKNDGVLPLDETKVKTIAVIGPNADRVLLGGYSGSPKQFVTVLDGIRSAVGKEVEVLYAEGCPITIGGSWEEDNVVLSDPADDRESIAKAVAMAEQADVVVLVVGGNEQTSREAWFTSHLGDRTDLQLVGLQNELADALHATGKPMVSLLFNGRPLAVGNLTEKSNALVECWYLGQETGGAVADVLLGRHNPSGRLAITLPRSVGHLPAFYNYRPSARRGYLFDDASPQFPFGYGLSYTDFEISTPKLARPVISVGESSSLIVGVTNTGDRAGEEVVQMYVRDKVSSVTRPVRELKGFVRVYLEPGQTEQVEIPIGPESLAFWNAAKQFVVEPGEFEIHVGPSSVDLQSITLRVTK